MVQKNVTEVKKGIETLTMLRAEVMQHKSQAVKAITEERTKLELILNEEEELYVAQNHPGADAVAIYDSKLNALSEAIGFLEERFVFPKQIVKNLDNAIMKLMICVTD